MAGERKLAILMGIVSESSALPPPLSLLKVKNQHTAMLVDLYSFSLITFMSQLLGGAYFGRNRLLACHSIRSKKFAAGVSRDDVSFTIQKYAESV